MAENSGFSDEISPTELKNLLDKRAEIQLIDVRQPEEYRFARIPQAKLIPLDQLLDRITELDPNREVVFYCKMGRRSKKAVEMLKAAGYKGKARSLRGGITAWSNEVDPKVSKY
ncbi:MAG TPA: rhodanese-like domain-containing protein [Pyrinomonadaceae bacterium]|nr:rhodanese-like domain-containing protein [Pyrinomonadaceae bacterium]